MSIHDPEFLRQVYVAVWRDLPSAEDLIEKAPINHLYVNDRQLLHVACWFNRGPLVAKLLARKALPLQEDGFGKTPLALAVESGSFAAFRAMVIECPAALFYISPEKSFESKGFEGKDYDPQNSSEVSAPPSRVWATPSSDKNTPSAFNPLKMIVARGLLDFWTFAWVQIAKRDEVPTEDQKKLVRDVVEDARRLHYKKAPKWISAIPAAYLSEDEKAKRQ